MWSAEFPRTLIRPRYGYAEADRIAGVSRGTSKRWLKGYEYVSAAGTRVRQPPVPDRGRIADAGVSFLELIEVAAIGKLKELRLSLRQIREVVDVAKEAFETEHPLVTLRFRTDGRQVFVEAGDDLVELSSRRLRRAWTDVLEPFLGTVDYAGEYVSRWWPRGKGRPIFVDPDYAYGLPVIARRGVRTEILYEQFLAGEGIRQIAHDFGLEEAEVEEAVQFEAQQADKYQPATV